MDWNAPPATRADLPDRLGGSSRTYAAGEPIPFDFGGAEVDLLFEGAEDGIESRRFRPWWWLYPLMLAVGIVEGAFMIAIAAVVLAFIAVIVAACLGPIVAIF